MGTHSLLFRVISFALLVLLIDLYLYFRLRAPSRTSTWAKWIRRSIFPVSIGYALLLLGYMLVAGLPGLDPVAYRRIFLFTGAFQLIWLPRLILAVVDIIWLAPGFLFRSSQQKWRKIGLYASLGLWIITTILCLHAIFFGKSAFQSREIELVIEELPNGFNGLRIAQFSDAHLGSFGNQESVRKGLRLLQSQNPDIIVFTGDLINTIAEEAWPYEADFKSLVAPLGKYAILGNHDIGDYVKGDTIRPPSVNRALLKDFYQKTGFTLLENQAILLFQDGDSLLIAGVDNWGLPPFRQDGDLPAALQKYPASPSILLSHDPSHWDAEVLKYPNIHLTLSGHTHGMQFGIYCKNFRWSPVEYKYPRWIGIYQEGDQYLYVNPGFGFIGMPSRLGISPEITTIILKGPGAKQRP